MTELQNIYKNLVPLSRAVNAAILDMYEDRGKVEQVYSHWAGRVLFQINMQILKSGVRSVLLHVNKNTHTATLPPDFNEEIFIGVLERGRKIPLRMDTALADLKNVEDIACEDKCEKCNADKSICDDLKITTETKIVEINSINYEQTITKKMYPNGDYFLESSIPVLDIETNTVSYKKSKEFIAHIDLKPCGCVEDSTENIETVRLCNPEVYGCHFAPCGNCNEDLGGYNIFEESGLIQLSPHFRRDKIFLQYRPSMMKINGQYYVPKIAFEALVEGIKEKAMRNKRTFSLGEKNNQWQHFVIEKNNLKIIKSRVSMQALIGAMLSTPKFDYYAPEYHGDCKMDIPQVEAVATNVCDVATQQSDTGSGGGSTTQSGYVPYSIGVIAGLPNAPVDGASSWQSNSLKDAKNLTFLILNDTTLTLAKGDFTFDPVTGIIDISPNEFTEGDVLVGNYFKKI